MKYSANLRYTLKVTCLLAFRFFLKLFWLFRIDEKKIFFMSFNGLQYSDSPKNISDRLLFENPEIKQVWAFHDQKKHLNLNSKGILILRTNSLSFIFHILTSKIIVVNDFINTYFPIRKNQKLLNTWHGGGSFKTVGMTTKSYTKYDLFFFKIHRKMTDTFVSSSDYFHDRVLKRSFLFEGNVLECGLPRNDLLFETCPEIKGKVREHFGIEQDKKIVLYAPTHRGEYSADSFLSDRKNVIDVRRCIMALNKRFGGEYVFLFRAHHIISSSNLNSESFNATNHPNMQELLYAADILLTDYSSCLWDFSLMDKPSFIFATDLDKYIDDRDFFMDINEWPFSISENNRELVHNILEFNENDFDSEIKKYFEKLGSSENGQATKRVCDWIDSNL